MRLLEIQESRDGNQQQYKTLFLGLWPQEVGAEQIPRSLLARTFPIPYATLRNGTLSERALVTLARNDSFVGMVGIKCHTILAKTSNMN